jgi:sporulation protein YlmC with PRC-barrel domain
MINSRTRFAIAVALAIGLAGPAAAQVAGATTTISPGAVESSRVAMGWSVKKTLMGKSIYNEAGDKVGKVEDLIIDPARNLSYVIVGAGGFIGIGRHDVAIPVGQIQDRAGKLVMPGATKDAIKAMAKFEYADDTGGRAKFIADAERDIAQAKAAVNDLTQKSAKATAEARAKIDADVAVLKGDVKATEVSLGKMKQATAVRWKEFEADVTAATARLRKSIDTAVG